MNVFDGQFFAGIIEAETDEGVVARRNKRIGRATGEGGAAQAFGHGAAAGDLEGVSSGPGNDGDFFIVTSSGVNEA